MAGAKVEITGLDQLRTNLTRIGKSVESEFSRVAKAGMEIYVEAPAKRNAPIDQGRLRGSIVTVDDKDAIRTGSNVKYAPYVEFGTGIYAENGNGRKTPWAYKYGGKKGSAGWRMTVGNKPQPYLRPAFDEGKDKVVKHISDELAKAARV